MKSASRNKRPGKSGQDLMKDFSSVQIPLDIRQIAALFPHFFLMDEEKRILHSDDDLREILHVSYPVSFDSCFRQHFQHPKNETDGNSGKIVLELLPESRSQQFEGNFISAGEGWTLFLGRRRPATFRLDHQEARYSRVFSNLHLGILEVNLEDRILYANQSFCEMSGYREEEMLGKPAREILLTRQGRRLLDSKMKLRKSGVSDAYELRVLDKEGIEKYWIVSGAPTYDDAGNLSGSVGIHLDITDHKRLESELIKAREMAEASARVKEDFLVNMSHEIRTPMHVITGMAELLSKTSLEKQQRFYLGNIRHAADTMLALMNDILDLSKMEAGKLSLENIPFEAASVLKRMMQVMQQSAEAKGLDLMLEFNGEGIAPFLLGDPHRLNQILYNLLSNAVKFTSTGKITVECRLEKEAGESQVLFFRVTDTGVGMDKAFLGRLFEKFSQEHGSTSRTAGGTGLGMNICKELIDLMGGEIEVKSRKNQGTEVSFRIPFRKAEKQKLPVSVAISEGREVFEGLKVLITDDNEMNRLVATTILSRLGAIVSEAENGEDAIEKFRNSGPDLILMDIRMPIMDGMEACRRIRQLLGGSLPVVALTAHAMKSEIDRFFEAGMNAYLPKPFSEEQLIGVVNSCMQRNIPDDASLPAEEAVVHHADRLWSLEKLRQLARGNEEFVQKMLGIFLEQTPPRLKEIKLASEKGDWKQVSDIAHKMKPGLDSLSIDSLKDAVRELERAGENTMETNLQNLLILISTLGLVLDDMGTYFRNSGG
jgi:PAS domain S-box-containing protein